jgi:hypothetical protein
LTVRNWEEIEMRKLLLFVFAAALLFCGSLPALAKGNVSMLAARVTSEKPGESALEVLFDQYAVDIRRHMSGADTDPARWARIAAALDGVGQQRNDYASHLYWYTDLEQAKAAATKTNRPILSLRLLGNLTDEYSCANSRFFRTVLYANPAVANYLRQNYILHWSSERAAPRITIDYGDGRKLERTITGNSVHYILDADGAPVDALPGLYGPGAFLRELIRTAAVVQNLTGKNAEARFALLAAYHQTRMTESTTNWEADLAAAGVNPREARSKAGQPSAVDAAPVAVTKAVVEFDMLKSITSDTRRLDSLTDLNAWIRIANRHLGDAALADSSLNLMRREMFPNQTGPLAAADQEVFDSAARRFQSNIALDGVRNEYMLRSQMHAWFVADGGYKDFATLNTRVYATLFLTPKSDPWLGLYSPDVYTGLENGGVKK